MLIFSFSTQDFSLSAGHQHVLKTVPNHSGEDGTHFPPRDCNDFREQQQLHLHRAGASEKTAPASGWSSPSFVKFRCIFFFQLYIHTLLKDSVFQFWKFFLDYFSTFPSLFPLFCLELLLFSYWTSWTVLKFCHFSLFSNFFCPAVILFRRFPQLTIFLLSFSFLLLHYSFIRSLFLLLNILFFYVLSFTTIYLKILLD